MKKNLKLVFCLLLLFSSLIPMIGYGFSFAMRNDANDSRSNIPSIIKNNSINVSFTLEFDDYFTKSFPFRAHFITAYNALYQTLFHQSGNEKVIVGKDGYLFFEETVDDILDVETLTEFDLTRLSVVLNNIHRSLDEVGVRSYVMVVPNKATVYDEYLPDYLKPIGKNDNLDRFLELELDMENIDLYNVLKNAKDTSTQPLYHKSDSHWNNFGAAIAYETMMDSAGHDSLDLFAQSPQSRNDWHGDLSKMLYPAMTVYDKQIYYDLPKKFIFSQAIRNFEDINIESKNPTQNGHLWMMRDSFANALIPYLSESWNQVNYSRAFPHDYRNVLVQQPDTLIIEIAQRNLNWLLQATPVIESKPKDVSIQTDRTINLDINFNQSFTSGLAYLNAYFTDQAQAASITEVKLIKADHEYDAFPIYQDNDFEDDTIDYGFSLYTATKLNLESVKILVKINGIWNLVTSTQ